MRRLLSACPAVSDKPWLNGMEELFPSRNIAKDRCEVASQQSEEMTTLKRTTSRLQQLGGFMED